MYFSIGLMLAVLPVLLLVVVVASNLWIMARWYITDSKDSWKSSYDITRERLGDILPYHGEELFIKAVAAAVVLAFVWPLVLVAALVWGVLYMLRTQNRLDRHKKEKH